MNLNHTAKEHVFLPKRASALKTGRLEMPRKPMATLMFGFKGLLDPRFPARILVF